MLDCEVVGKLILNAVPHSFQITNVHSSSGYFASFRKESTTHNQRYRRSSGSKDRDASPSMQGGLHIVSWKSPINAPLRQPQGPRVGLFQQVNIEPIDRASK